MSKREKLLKRLLSIPSDFTFEELKSLLDGMGFKMSNKGKTSGSRVAFLHHEKQLIVRVHKPHPTKIMGKTALKNVVEFLKEKNLI